MREKLLILLVFCLPAVGKTAAQDYVRYGLSEGLSGIEVTDIKENKNYIWIATSNGLNRFDGKNFSIFKRNPGQPNSISSNNIETLFFDSKGRLWIGLKNGGLDVYDPEKDRFLNISAFIDIQAPERVISVFEDSSGEMWLGTWEQGVYQLTPENPDSLKFRAQKHYPGYIVSAFIEEPKGFIRVGTYTGLLVFDRAKKEWIYPGTPNKVINHFLPTGKPGTIWCSTWDAGLLEMTWDKLNPAKTVLKSVLPPDETVSIHRILNGPGNSLYLGTWGSGLLNLDMNNPKAMHLLEKSPFSPSFINCIYRDKFRNVWVGTFGEGLLKFNPDYNGIRHFPPQGTLSKPAVSIIPAGNGKILIGTQGAGILEADLKKETVQPRFQEKFSGNFKNYVLLLHSDEKHLFFTHDGTGIYFDEEANDSKIILKEILPDITKVTAIYAENERKVWFGTKQNGLVSVESDASGISSDTTNYPVIAHNEITGITPLNERELFISSNNGLVIFNKVTRELAENGILISDEPVFKILNDPADNILWVGTSNNVFAFNPEKPGSLIPLFPEKLMPTGPVRTLITDGGNNLWFSAGERLFCKMHDEKTVREINTELTGKNAILSATKTTIDNNEILIFGTSQNLILVNPKLILSQTEKPEIILSSLQIDNQEIKAGDKLYGEIVLEKSPEYAKSLVLSHKCRWISLTFAETGQAVFKNYYQFRIRDFSENWQFTGLDNPVTFSQLLPGEYTLEIKSVNSDENDSPDWSLKLTVTPPWWEKRVTKISAVLVLLLVATLLLLSIYRRVQRRHAQKLGEIEKEKKEELIREKEGFITGLSHDFLTTFSLILAPVNDLLREGRLSETNREKLEIIKKNTSFLSDMFGAIFDFKKTEFSDRQIKETNIELNLFIHLCTHAFEYLAVSKNITLEYRPGFEKLNVKIDHVKLERIIYNLLSNSLKYTPDGGSVQITANFDKDNQAIIIGVKDTGIGMDPKNQPLVFEKFYREPVKKESDSPQGLGLGLFIVKKFVDLLGGTISVKSEPGHGTTFTVKLPVQLAEEEIIPDENIQAVTANEKSTILVVEDNRQLLDYTVKKLKTHFHVLSAGNGTEAMELVEKHIPEIVITDIIMPGSDGLELTRAIKNDTRFSDIFVVILSAKATTDDELAGYRHGADIYLKKPIDTEVLLNQMVNIHKTRLKRKTQLYSELISKTHTEIEFDSKENFLKMAIDVMEKHLMDADFNLDDFASELNVSKSVLHRKFKLLVGQTPNQFMRLVRLRKAVEQLEKTDLSISEIAYMTGFSQAHYFIKCFREVYNDTPKNYREKNRKSS